MTNNIQVNKDNAIFKLIYKICNHQKGGTCFDIVLLINTATNEVLGMGKIKPTLPQTQYILCNLSGNWSFINANADDGIHISVEGKVIDRTDQDSQSRKNAEIRGQCSPARRTDQRPRHRNPVRSRRRAGRIRRLRRYHLA